MVCSDGNHTFGELDVSRFHALLDLCSSFLGCSGQLGASLLQPLLAPRQPCLGSLLHVARPLALLALQAQAGCKTLIKPEL